MLSLFHSLVAALALASTASALKYTQPNLQLRSNYRSGALPGLNGRQLPAAATGVKTLTTPQNITFRYKEPGKEGVCETTPGVNSYSGYIDLDENAHTFFWFFEARNNPEDAPITLWLNGGPGSDSLIGLFQELGPCNVTANLTTELNPWAWNEVSNMLFLSQPLGTGFSYSQEEAGSLNTGVTGVFQNASVDGIKGRYPIINATDLDTTELAAVAAWHVLQGFLGGLDQLNPGLKSRSFNLATESYGGHYGPTFFRYFSEQNELIKNGTQQGVQLQMDSLLIINGIINEVIQAPYYPEFAVNNTYGIKSINDTVYSYMKFAANMLGGCIDQINACESTNKTAPADFAVCAEAANMCRDNVESPYYYYGGRGVYDIRHPINDPTPPSYFVKYLNQASVQNALGVDLNYTQTNADVYWAFQVMGDFIYNDFLSDLETVLDNGVRVALIYGDADYICNWFGGEAVSKEVKYKHTKEFNAAGYSPFMVAGEQYGEVRQYGNFSFAIMYEAGHEVPYYQPEASLEAFRRVLLGLDYATGNTRTSATFSSTGGANSTHTAPYVPLPNETKPPAVVRKGRGMGLD